MKKIVGYILAIIAVLFLIVILISFLGPETKDYGVLTVFSFFILGLGLYLIRKSKSENQSCYPDSFSFKEELFLRFKLTSKEYLSGFIQITPISRLFIYIFPVVGISNLFFALITPYLDDYTGEYKDVSQILIENIGSIIMIFAPLIGRFFILKQFHNNESLSGQQTYRFDGETVTTTVNDFESQFDTRKFYKIKKTPTLVILFIQKYQGVIIPRRAFSNAHEWEVFLEAIQINEST